MPRSSPLERLHFLGCVAQCLLGANRPLATPLDTLIFNAWRHSLLGPYAFSLLFQPGLAEQYKPELDAAIKLLLFRFSVFANEVGPGIARCSLTRKHRRH